MEEVEKHNSLESCWTVIDGLVYDITHFVPSHPGGSRKIMRGAGKDSSKEFKRSHKAGWEDILESPTLTLLIIGKLKTD